MNRLTATTYLSTLARLYVCSRCAVEGFRTAARHVRTPLLRAELFQYAWLRESFVQEIRQAVRPADASEFEALLKRTPSGECGWGRLMTIASFADERSLLDAVIEAEEEAMTLYGRIRNADALQGHFMIFRTQQVAIARVLERLRSLSHSDSSRDVG